MKFSLWMEKRNQKSATKMPEKMSNLELVQRAAGKNINNMKYGRAGTIQPKNKKGTRSEKNRQAIKDQY